MGPTRNSRTASFRSITALTAILLICASACSGTQTIPTGESRPGAESSAKSENIKKALELTPWTTNILFVIDLKELRERADLHPELLVSFTNSLRDATETRFDTDEITPEEVDLFIYAASTNGYENGAVLPGETSTLRTSGGNGRTRAIATVPTVARNSGPDETRTP